MSNTQFTVTVSAPSGTIKNTFSSRLSSMFRRQKSMESYQPMFNDSDVTLPVVVALPNHRKAVDPSAPVRKHKTHLEKIKQGNYVAYTTLSASMMR